MKKLNNKGFLLVETLIVSVFVLTIFVMIYKNSIPMTAEYSSRSHYDDIDSVYDIVLLMNIIKEDANYASFISEVNTNGYKDITNCNVLSTAFRSACEVLKTKIGIESDDRVYLSTWNVSKLATDNTLPRGLLEYVKYIKNRNEEEQLEHYRLIVSRTLKYEVLEFSEEQLETIKTKKEARYANIGLQDYNS